MEKEFSGKSIEEAVESAAAELGVGKDAFTYEVIDYPKKGFLGIGSSPAKIKVKYEVSVEDTVEEYLSGLFDLIGLDGCKTTISVEGEQITIQIDGENAEVFTQKQGDAIEALQMVIALTVNHGNNNKYKVTLNINNYREECKERLEALALKVSEQVLKSHRRVTLNPMSAYQRRIIHSKLQDVENITTFSVGHEPNRKVVVSYDGPDAEKPQKKPYFNKGGYNKDGGNFNKENGFNKDGQKFQNKKPYGKKPYGDRKPRYDRQPAENTEAVEPTVELRAGEKRAVK